MGTGTGSSGVRSLPREEPDVEQLFQSWVDEEDDDGVMRRALGTAATGLATKTPQRVRTNVPMSPPQTVPNSDRAAEDPYLAMGNPDVTPNSVGTGGPLGTAGPPGLSPQVPCHPGQRDRDLLRVPTHEAPPRTGIKDASKRRAVTPRQHVSLEEKLQERRQRELAKGSAMRPFRTGQVPEAPGFRTSTQKGSDRVLGNKEVRRRRPRGRREEWIWGARVKPASGIIPGAKGQQPDVVCRLAGRALRSSDRQNSSCQAPGGQDAHNGASDLSYPGLIRFHSQVYSSVRAQALEFQSLPRPCEHANPLSTVVLGHGPASLGFGCGGSGPSPGLRTNVASLAAVSSSYDRSIAANAPQQAEGPSRTPGAEFQGCHVPHQSLPAQLTQIVFLALLWSADPLIAIARSLLGIFGLILFSLLVHQLPGGHTPLGRFLALPFKGLPRTAVRALGASTAPHLRTLDWSPWRDRKGRTNSRGPCKVCSSAADRQAMRRLICCILGFACFPSQVWAAPKAVQDLLPVVQEAITFSPESMPEHADPSGDHGVPHLYGGHRFEVSGIPAPVAGQGMPCAEDTCLVNCTAFVVAPFFQPEVVTFKLQLPCEESDVVRATQRNLQHLALEHSDAIAPAYPQPCQECQTMIVYPAWASFAGLTAIVMDLRLSPLSGNGPIIAAFVTRPTNLAELRRETGIYAVRTCNVFASSSPDALEDDELIYLDHGALVRFVPVEQEPLTLSRLYIRLQHKEAWETEQTAPAIPRAGSLICFCMLKAVSSSVEFRRQGQSLDAAAAEFVGVQRTSVSYHSPRGRRVRKILAQGKSLEGHPGNGGS